MAETAKRLVAKEAEGAGEAVEKAAGLVEGNGDREGRRELLRPSAGGRNCGVNIRLRTMWRHVWRRDGQHVWEGLCGVCGRPATVQADDREAAAIRRELDTFGDLECPACASDRLHEFDHIARAASELDHARILREAPLAGSFRGEEHERTYRAWCAGRGLAPLPARPRGAIPSRA